MAIDIPRIVPIQTPLSESDEELRVRKLERMARIPADLGHPRIDRRQLLDRRREHESRLPQFELRNGRERRQQDSSSAEMTSPRGNHAESPGGERRSSPDRRLEAEPRPSGLEIRSGHERRHPDGVDIDV